MEIKSFILGELQTNCYIVIDQNTKQCLIIDPADEANFISEQILRQNLKPTAIIATHGHFDHILATYELQMAFNIPFYIHPKDLLLVKNLQKNASFWTKRKIIERLPTNIKFLKDDDKVNPYQKLSLNLQKSPVDKVNPCQWTCQWKTIHTPGHTPGSVCLYFPEESTYQQAGILLTGDTLFSNGIGRTDLSYSSKKDLQNSLKKLSKLPLETKIYPGHGESSNLKVLANF